MRQNVQARMRACSIAAIAVMAVLVFWPDISQGYIGAIEVVPSHPGPDDIVTIHVGGYLNDACWSTGQPTLNQVGNTFYIEITGYDVWGPEIDCAMVIVPYLIEYEVGPLSAGQYTIVMTEHHQSARLPWPFIKTADFAVGCENSPCGDANCDQQVDIGDAVYIINYVFKNGPGPYPYENGDVNGDGRVNIGDAVYLVNFIFRSGPAPTG